MNTHTERVESISEHIQNMNCQAVSRILKRQTKPHYDDVIMKIAEAKDMLNRMKKMFPSSNAYIKIEIEPVELHLLDEIMHDLKGTCRDFVGELKEKNGTIVIKSK